MKIKHKEFVCLVTENELQAAHARYRDPETGHSLVLEALWRQIQISGTSSVLFLELESVNEETAQGGEATVGADCARFGFTWDDLDDLGFLQAMVRHEQFAVAAKALQILTMLRLHRVGLQKRLAITEPAKNKSNPDTHRPTP